MIDTDASTQALGCVLQQYQDGVLRVISYSNRVLSPAEANYCTTRRELTAVIYGLKTYRHFLVGRRFTLRTDHAALTYLWRTPEPVGQSARYLNTLAEFDFEVKHRPGLLHSNSDALSRRPCARVPDQPPCRQCRQEVYVQCKKLHPKTGAVPRSRQFGTPSLLSVERLSEEQKKDPVLDKIRKWISEPNLLPTLAELQAEEPDVQELYAQRQTLEVRNDVLYRQFVRTDGTLDFYQVVVLHALRAEFLEAAHSGAMNGHMGVEKTREQLRQMAYWRGWTEDVRLYVNRCNTCYRPGPGKKQGAMQQALGCTVMQKVHIDLTGPHPISRNGYKYLLTAICSLSKFLIAVPIRDKTSLVFAKALLKNVYLVYGLPEILVHDQGGEFWSDVMTDLEVARHAGVEDHVASSFQ